MLRAENLFLSPVYYHAANIFRLEFVQLWAYITLFSVMLKLVLFQNAQRHGLSCPSQSESYSPRSLFFLVLNDTISER